VTDSATDVYLDLSANQGRYKAYSSREGEQGKIHEGEKNERTLIEILFVGAN
jgi:hypothetical protein